MHIRSRNVSDCLILWWNHSLKTQREEQTMNFALFSLARDYLHSLVQAVKRHLRQWTRSDNHDLVLNSALDLTRSNSELVLKNLLLRQQLIVLKQQAKRPALTWDDLT
jgi:hypothetical protein